MDFSIRLGNQLMLKDVEKGSNKNIVFSPSSLNALLNILAAGTSGPTFDQMLQVLGAKNMEEINSKSLKMIEVTSNNGMHGPVFSIVNGVWAAKEFPLKSSYKEVLKDVYNCESQTVDFLNKLDEVVEKINSWAKEASRGLITSIVNQWTLPPYSKIVLANALYFKGEWKKCARFDAELTENRDFYLLNGDIISVPFMTSHHKGYSYGSFDGFKVVKIPYQSGDPPNTKELEYNSDESCWEGEEPFSRQFFMYFFLPNEQDGLQNLLKEFKSNPGLFQERLSLGDADFDEFWIPKFKFSYNVDLKECLENMGLTLPFTEDADFSEMANVSDELSISCILQKAFIEIDEKGTEAAAITYGVLVGCSLIEPEKERFVADHPFIFMIKEETSGLVFFTGAILNPINAD